MKTKKILVMALAALLLVAVSVGGTVAYLTAATTAVTNTFAPTSIEIELLEHELKDDGTLDETKEVASNEGYKLYPGATLPKDPFVRVKEGNCFIFVEVVNNATTYIETPDPVSGWEELTDADGGSFEGHYGGTVYGYVGSNSGNMQAVAATDTDNVIEFLETIQVKTSVTADILTETALENVNLKFYAYAIQADHLGSGFTSPDTVWTKIPNPNTGN